MGVGSSMADYVDGVYHDFCPNKLLLSIDRRNDFASNLIIYLQSRWIALLWEISEEEKGRRRASDRGGEEPTLIFLKWDRRQFG
ncbi:hypothetical protein Nepgr_030798 [Nepenthes gracilis]|uniref:Uncharacterized protein n=1 Tax=Nepenthes gracilis TaxID=150966 RepID=A0AAD3TF96_NEPGR|nr:hypothetical protein Nepgr_030798 [Nepenthes gracilis]